MAAEFLETESVLIMNGDTYIDFPIHNFIFYGRDLIFDEVGFVLNVKNGITNMGLYFLNKELLMDIIPKSKPYSLEKSLLFDAFEDEPKCFLINAPFIDIGTPESYASASDFMREFVQ
jgi:NDP-sugar pyrophosphorylase family protein